MMVSLVQRFVACILAAPCRRGWLARDFDVPAGEGSRKVRTQAK